MNGIFQLKTSTFTWCDDCNKINNGSMFVIYFKTTYNVAE